LHIAFADRAVQALLRTFDKTTMKNAPEGAFLLAFGGVDVINTVYLHMSFYV
jgi:hypothetical protein